ncbi:MAG: class I SAM-dependent methyltransferase [Pseudomonadales bacterium]|nr:class I SAM-dependent methyltransferase [Pseudomonadales bacterium]
MKIEKLPLYWRLKSPTADGNIVPDFHSFEFGFNEDIQMIRQDISVSLESYLNEIYKAEYNIGYLQDDNVISKGYGIDFKSFMDGFINDDAHDVSSILEVGCGGCTLLKQYDVEGFEVLGVDPSPIAAKSGIEKSIEVISDFFPSEKICKNYDVIFHSDVLEHVSDPVRFLSNQKKQLSKNGLIFISIPDCNESIQKGDVSMIIHQHINYFDNESLANCIEASGLRVVSIETASYGGSLYACAQNSQDIQFEPRLGVNKYQQFLSLTQASVTRLTSFISASIKAGETLGFYVPLRALPYISLLGITSGVRFFDDTDHWYGCAFDGVDVCIENFSDLQRDPVDTLIVCSLTFADVIKSKIQASSISIKEIKILDDFIG